MFMHIDRNGKKYKLSELEDSHLNNIITMIERKAKEGVEILFGCGGMGVDDFWCDYEVITGDEVLNRMGYKEYINERKRREEIKMPIF